jgi:hypothetical protein
MVGNVECVGSLGTVMSLQLAVDALTRYRQASLRRSLQSSNAQRK